MAIWIILQSSINGRFPINVKKKEGIYQEMRELGWSPGTQLFLNDVNITKEQGFGQFNLAGKWKKTYRGFQTKEPWYILTNFGDLETAIIAYQKRFEWSLNETSVVAAFWIYSLKINLEWKKASWQGDWKNENPIWKISPEAHLKFLEKFRVEDEKVWKRFEKCSPSHPWSQEA